MATISLSLPGRLLIDEAIGFFRREHTDREAVARKVRRVPEPESFPVPGVAREILVKVASEPEEWEQAFELVAANYHERGYETVNRPYRFTPHHALPDTTVFVAKREGRVIATFSLVADNNLLGLPMESLYASEVGDLRRQGRRMAEVTSLAMADLGQREFLQVFMTLIKVLMQYHVSRGGDTWVLTVNPRHRNFYCKVIGCEPLGPCKPYEAVANAPAEAYLVDRRCMRTNSPSSYERVFGEQLPDSVLTGVPVPRPFIRYFWGESHPADDARLGTILQSVVFGSPRAW